MHGLPFLPRVFSVPSLLSLKRNFILSFIRVDVTLCVEAGFFQLSYLSPNTLLFTGKQTDASFQSRLV